MLWCFYTSTFKDHLLLPWTFIGLLVFCVFLLSALSLKSMALFIHSPHKRFIVSLCFTEAASVLHDQSPPASPCSPNDVGLP